MYILLNHSAVFLLKYKEMGGGLKPLHSAVCTVHSFFVVVVKYKNESCVWVNTDVLAL